VPAVSAGKGVSEIVAVKLERPIKFLAKAHEIQEIRKTKEVWERRGLEDWLSAEIDKIETEDDLKVLYFKTKPYWTLDHVNKAKNKF
jgi:hypothetical protein